MPSIYMNARHSTEYSRWSFGGNRLQIKADVRLMADVNTALQSIQALFTQPSGSLQSFANKQELLSVLIENERMRLIVWLFPLDHERRNLIHLSHSGKGPSDVSSSSPSGLFDLEDSCSCIVEFAFYHPQSRMGGKHEACSAADKTFHLCKTC